ncbi:hypothetical protein ACFVXC_00215 [Streptomyces sp. NPDC058257]|uniref:hypothetical protein n=1 Tax=Streptomyces sp. NPDC058257 TaxID=3346409 RepID=UPI0036EFC304
MRTNLSAYVFIRGAWGAVFTIWVSFALNGVEGGGGLRITITDEVSEPAGVLAEDQQGVLCLLGDPGTGGVRGDAEYMHGAGVVLHDEEDIDTSEGDGVDVEEVTGQQPFGLVVQELAPRLLIGTPGRGRESGGTQRPVDRGGTDAMTETV